LFRIVWPWISHFNKTFNTPKTQSNNIRAKVESCWGGDLKEILKDTLKEDELKLYLKLTCEECVDYEIRTINVHKYEFMKTYKDILICLLESNKFKSLNIKSLEWWIWEKKYIYKCVYTCVCGWVYAWVGMCVSVWMGGREWG